MSQKHLPAAVFHSNTVLNVKILHFSQYQFKNASLGCDSGFLYSQERPDTGSLTLVVEWKDRTQMDDLVSEVILLIDSLVLTHQESQVGPNTELSHVAQPSCCYTSWIITCTLFTHTCATVPMCVRVTVCARVCLFVSKW